MKKKKGVNPIISAKLSEWGKKGIRARNKKILEEAKAKKSNNKN